MSLLNVLGRRNLSSIFASCNLLVHVTYENTNLTRTFFNYTNRHFLFCNEKQSYRKSQNIIFKTNMSTTMLDAIPNVEIDPDGTFKYILVRVYAPQTPDGTEPSKLIIRGNKRGPYHADIYDEAVKKITGMNLDSECIGGGKIQHDSAAKKIKIFGSSQGFGKADHHISAEILKEVFSSYEITCDDDSS